jgi:NTE family protein
MPASNRFAKPTLSSPNNLHLHTKDEECVLVLQGGGALGAYQAGVFEALSHAYPQPSWVAGISIGAINAALIAGNTPANRLVRLREFWDLVSSTSAGLTPPNLPLCSRPPEGVKSSWGGPAIDLRTWWAFWGTRQALNDAHTQQAVIFGVPGFFSPRLPPAPFQPPGTLGAISYYDTTPLKHTLERLVDFDLINTGTMRLSVGAVNVRTGNFEYFDSTQTRIDARHIMASGALPPGFAPVEIDGEHYWDGGLVSNTPLQHVLDRPSARHRVVFQVDLFAAQGALPATMSDVTEREKEIRFSSRTRLNTSNELKHQRMAQAAQRLLAKLPAKWRDDPDAQLLAGLRCAKAVDVVHVIYRSNACESHAKDCEFSRISMQEHWAAGRADMAQSLSHPSWRERSVNTTGVHVYDLNHPKDSTI